MKKADKLDKQELRRVLLEGMCRYVQEVPLYQALIFKDDLYKEMCFGFDFFIGKYPVAFKPGVSDRMLFNKIIDNVIDEIISSGDIPFISTPMNILTYRYYPQYGDFDEEMLEKARRGE